MGEINWQHYVRAALNELGVPTPDYPANVANAVDLLRAVLDEAAATDQERKRPAFCILPPSPTT